MCLLTMINTVDWCEDFPSTSDRLEKRILMSGNKHGVGDILQHE